jgi:hypothetical protein
MLARLTKSIEFLANIAILVVASLLATSLVKNYWINPTPTASIIPQTSASSVTNLSALQVDWKQSNQTLVLAVSSTCHFCSESAPFYKTLASNKGDTRIIAVLPQSVEEGRKYLSKLGVAVDDIKQVPLNEIGVSGTPSLVLVDNSGVVKNFWFGKLSVEKEQIVLEAVRKQRG